MDPHHILCFSYLASNTMELAQQSIKGIPKHILLNSSPCVLSCVSVSHPTVPLCFPLLFCPIGTHHYCLYCPPLTVSSLLVFWVLPLFRCLTVYTVYMYCIGKAQFSHFLPVYAVRPVLLVLFILTAGGV